MLKYYFLIVFTGISLFTFGFSAKDTTQKKSLLVSITPSITGIYRLSPSHALGTNASIGIKFPINKKNNFSFAAGFWYSSFNKGFKNFEINKNIYSFYYLSLPFRYQKKTRIIDFNFELAPLILIHQNFIKVTQERKYNLNYSFDLSKSIEITNNNELSIGMSFLTNRNLFYIHKRESLNYPKLFFMTRLSLRIELLIH